MLNHCHWSECFTTIIFQIIPDLGFLTMWSAAQACCHACIYIASYGEDFCTFYEDERSTDCSTDWNKGQTVAFQGNFEPRYTFWSCMYMWLVYCGSLPTICYVYCLGLLVDYITRHSSRSVLIFRKSNRRSTSIHCSYHCASAYWHWEENVANESFSRSKRLTTTWAVIAHYAPPLDDFWTNQLVIVGEAPHLSQTGYKACSYVRIHCDNT